MFLSRVALLTCLVSAVADSVLAEKHTITFDNQCGYGSPRLIQKGNILSTGEPFTSNGPFNSAIAYLQTGKPASEFSRNCLLNGEGCTTVEMTLTNPTCPGCGSSTDISLIPPLKYSIPTGFSYQGGCHDQGATCATADCKTAFFVPDDNHVQVQCQDNDVDLLITFCGGSGTNLPVTTLNVQPSVIRIPATSTAPPVTPPVKVLPASSTTSSTTRITTSSSSNLPSPISNAPQCARNGSRRRRRSQAASTALQTRSPRAIAMHSHRRRLKF